MIKQITAKQLQKHITAWLVWFTLRSLHLFVDAPTMTAGDWQKFIFDYLSVIPVFYGVLYLTTVYYKTFSAAKYAVLSGLARFIYLLKRPLLLAVGIVLLYAALAVLLDVYVFKVPFFLTNDLLPNFPKMQTDGLLPRIAQRLADLVIPYMILAVSLASFTRIQQETAANQKELEKEQASHDKLLKEYLERGGKLSNIIKRKTDGRLDDLN